VSRSQKAQRERKAETPGNPWKGLKPATGGPRLTDVVSPIPYSLQDKKAKRRKKKRGPVVPYDISENLLTHACKAYQKRFPGAEFTGANVLHEALKAFISELQFQDRLMDKLKADLST